LQGAPYGSTKLAQNSDFTHKMWTVCATCDARNARMLCARCTSVSFCDRACHLQGWPSHKVVCKRIAREKKAFKEKKQEAEVKANEAANDAVESCRLEVPSDAVCYLCLCDKALVRSCSCRGTSGFAHVECLAKLGKSREQPSEAAPNGQHFDVWITCQACFQQHTGVVLLALVRRLWLDKVGCDGKLFESGIQMICGGSLYNISATLGQPHLLNESLAMLEACVATRERSSRRNLSKHSRIEVYSRKTPYLHIPYYARMRANPS
jgi:hypothetical protein